MVQYETPLIWYIHTYKTNGLFILHPRKTKIYEKLTSASPEKKAPEKEHETAWKKP